jgi:hypothetical protein
MVDVVTDTSYVNALVAADCVLVAVRLIVHVVKSLVADASPMAVQSINLALVHARSAVAYVVTDLYIT